jgi:hypothetical protein
MDEMTGFATHGGSKLSLGQETNPDVTKSSRWMLILQNLKEEG